MDEVVTVSLGDAIARTGRAEPTFRDGIVAADLYVGVLQQIQGWILAEAPEGSPDRMLAIVAIAKRADLPASYVIDLLENRAKLTIEALFALAIAFDQLPTISFAPFTDTQRQEWFERHAAGRPLP